MKSLIAALWDKILFWKKQKMPKHNVDYVLIDSDEGDITGVGIKTGKFAGVLYHYGKARINEEGELARLQFSYTIVSSPTIPIDDLIIDEEFHNFIGDILTDILMSQQNHYEEIRNNDPKEFAV